MSTGNIIFYVACLLILIAAGVLIYLTLSGSEPAQMTDMALTPEAEQQESPFEILELDEPIQAVMQTNHGEIELELYPETPITISNFVYLAEEGFYDQTLFHRVIEGFMIQGGDPNTRDDAERTYGTGGPGYTIVDEFVDGLSNTTGTLAMANSGPNTGGSQFFINTADNTYLDNRHTVFGEVTSGMAVVRAIEQMTTKEQDIPVEPVIIETIEIIR